MSAIGQFLSQVFTGPRVTWGALALAGLIILLLIDIGAAPDLRPETLEIVVLTGWGLLIGGGSFFGVLLALDIVRAVQSHLNERARNNFRAKVLSAPEDAQAIVAFFAVRNESTAWIDGRQVGLLPFRTLGLGTLERTKNGACLIEIDSTFQRWLQKNLAIVQSLMVSEASQAKLIDALDTAHQCIAGDYA